MPPAPKTGLVEALAPHIFSTHMKDMALAPCEKGFLLSKIPPGTGMHNLPGIIKTCTDANPQVQLNLEMTTRGPLIIPVPEERYWQTMATLPAPDLAHALETCLSRHCRVPAKDDWKIHRRATGL